MNDVFIYDALRTPRGKVRDGALQRVTPIRLAAAPMRALHERNAFPTDAIEEVVLGCVVPFGEQGGDIARSAVLAAGYDPSVPGAHLNRFCSSGLDAVNMISGQIAAGQAGLAVAGGVESMSRVPMGSDQGAWVSDPRETFLTRYIPQGVAADLIATLRGYSRDDVDGYAVSSQQRAAAAQAGGHFDRSVIPVGDVNGVTVLERDDNIRPQTTKDTLGRLEPAFAKMTREQGYGERAKLAYPQLMRMSHVHTAGNSSAIVDGAAAVLLGSREAGERYGLKPRAKIRAWASIGSDPTAMLTGPTPASERALARAGMTAADIDLFEVNEAFAAVVLNVVDEMKLELEKVNVNGGAIALGHPLGASGALLLGTVLDELERRDLSTGLITLCVAGGMGVATIIERT
ncbi:acetyl-CoA C-acetyltransferase [Sphingobium sp.]|uniref:acetyl-CoA C-acetyltransferase n=1 Tax=Sphingobium sp. TaxID=1912891 RepID=UPI0028BE379C|nr:acetyl-CoA C-acetyltransferase [Sphingobium sp.]